MCRFDHQRREETGAHDGEDERDEKARRLSDPRRGAPPVEDEDRDGFPDAKRHPARTDGGSQAERSAPVFVLRHRIIEAAAFRRPGFVPDDPSRPGDGKAAEKEGVRQEKERGRGEQERERGEKIDDHDALSRMDKAIIPEKALPGF